MTTLSRLRALKLVHTVIWAFFVTMIGAIWVCAAQGDLTGAGWAIAIVMVECVILGLNRGQCPLGKFAERYTDDRTANFDICVPAWLAGRTKPVFGSLFAGGILFTAIRWVIMPR